MSKKSKAEEKEHVFSEIEVDIDEKTRAYLVDLGCTEFNKLSDEALEQMMLDYGATIALGRSLEMLKSKNKQQPPPISIYDDRIDTVRAESDGMGVDDWDDCTSPAYTHSKKDTENIKNRPLPSVELDELAEMIISAFLEVTPEEIREYAKKYEEEYEYSIKGSANDFRWERILKYLKMSRQRRRKHLSRWLDEIVEQFR